MPFQNLAPGDDPTEYSLLNYPDGKESITLLDRLRASAVARVWPDCVFHGLFALAVVLLHKNTDLKVFAVDPVLPTMIGVVIGYALNLRTTTSYSRWYEGRCLWSQTAHALRFLAQLVWLNVPLRVEKGKEADQETRLKLRAEKEAVLQLIEGYAYALKHHLRFETGIDYEDSYYLLEKHFPDMASSYNTFDHLQPARLEPPSSDSFRSAFFRRLPHFGFGSSKRSRSPSLKQSAYAAQTTDDVPERILLKLSTYVAAVSQKALVDTPLTTAMMNQLDRLDDQLSSYVRILTTPIPYAYAAHLDHILAWYLFLLPVQLCEKLGWFTVVAVVTCTFFFRGFIEIGIETQQPFGYNLNDLPMDLYCEKISTDIKRVKQFSADFNTGQHTLTKDTISAE